MRACGALAAAGVVVLVGCDSGELFVSLSDDAQAAVMLIRELGGGEPWIAALGREALTAEPGPLQSGRSAELVLLEYPDALEVLGLPKGTIGTSVDPFSPALPPEPHVRIAQFDGDLGPWSAASAPAWVSALRLDLAPELPCLDFRRRSFRLSGTLNGGRVRAVLPLDGTRVLVAVEGTGFFEVSLDGARPLPELDAYQEVMSAHRLPSGEIWIVLRDHRVFRGDLEAGFTPGPNLDGDRLGSLTGPGPGDDGTEIYFADADGRLFSGSSSGWTLVGSTTPAVDTNWMPVAWLGPGQVMFATSTADDVLFLRDGRVQTIPKPDLVYSIARLPGLGPVIGTALGSILEWTGEEWRELVEAGSLTRVTSIAPIPGGLLFGGRSGIVRQHFFDPAFTCEHEVILDGDLGPLTHFEGMVVAHPKFGSDGGDLEISFLFAMP